MRTLLTLLFASTAFGLSGDLNNDGIVDFEDFAIFSEQWLQEKEFTFVRRYTIEQEQPMLTFARDSIAFLDGQEIDTDVLRSKEALLVSTTDGTLVTGGGVGGANVIPQCVVGGVLYGIEGNSWPGRLCRSTDGITWERTASSQAVSSVTGTPDNNLFAINNTTKTLFRSVDGGDTWIDVTPAGDNALSATAFIAARWCVRHHGGTMLMAEYGTSARFGGRYIFRSVDDGVTWLRCFDAADITDVEANQIMHFHGVAYHAATGRWIAVAGDNPERRTNVYSEDDGLTWQVLNPPGTYFTQPLGGFIDYGDPEYLLVGDDGYSSIQLFSVLTGNVVNLYSGFSRDTGNYYVFDLIEHDGLYYAFKASTTAGIYDMSILVSRDRTNWSVFHNFDTADKISQVYYAGFLNAKLHCFALNTVDSVFKHFKFTPAATVATQGTLVTPAAVNLLNENLSSIETNASLWINNAIGWTSVGQSDDFALHGTKSVKVVLPEKADTGSLTLGADLSLVTGKTYLASAVVKGSNTLLDFRAYWRPNPTTGQAFRSDSATYMVDAEWKTIYTKPFTVAEGEEDFYRFYFTLPGTSANYVNVAPRTVYLDCIQVIEVPHAAWQVGGTPQAADTLTETVTVGKLWTDVFAIQALEAQQYYTASAPLIIKTWALDANNKIDIEYNPATAKFQIVRTIDGTPQTAAESAATYWHGNACIKFALSVSGTASQLQIQNGRAIEILRDGGLPALLDAEIIGTFGNFPMVVLDWNRDEIVPFWVDNAGGIFDLLMPHHVSYSGNVEL
jgi:hypothetical protein